VIECVPDVSFDVAKVATPLLLSGPVPSIVVPSRKVIVPVGVAPAGMLPVLATAAVHVTVVP
jgi:hypothetical protein